MLKADSPYWLFCRLICVDGVVIAILLLIAATPDLSVGWRRSILDNLIALQFALTALVLALPHLWRWWRWMLGMHSNSPVRLGLVGRFPRTASTWKPVALHLAPQQLPPGPHDAGWRRHCGFVLLQLVVPLACCVCVTVLFGVAGKWTIIFSASMWLWTLGGLCELGLAAMGLQPRWIEANSPTTYLASYMGVVRTVPVERIAAMADMPSGAIVIDVDGTFSIRVHPGAIAPDEEE